MALPSGYEYADVVFRQSTATSSPYFDLGVVPTNTMKVSALFQIAGDIQNWVFGARNSNSNTSAGQLNLYMGGQNSASYIGYASARISLGNDALGTTSFQKTGNEFVLNVGNTKLHEVTGATTTFTGTRNMYLFALNNAGTATFGSSPLYGNFACFRIYESDVMTHEYVPVYNTSTNEQCLYDTVTDSVIQKSGSGDWHYYSENTHHLLTVKSTNGGKAYIETKINKLYTKLYCRYASDGFSVSDTYEWFNTKIHAVADNGYSFIGWEKDGSIVSTEETIFVAISEDTLITAKFVKNVSDFQRNNYYLMCIKYGTVDSSNKDILFYVPVLSASIKEDGMAKTTSTIVCKEVPSLLVVNTIVVLKNPKGKALYCGVVKSISDKTLTCREPLSLFDTDFLFGVTSSTKQTLMYSIGEYIGNYSRGYPSYQSIYEQLNRSVVKMMNPVETHVSREISIDNNLNMNFTQPVIDSINVANLEDFLLQCFDDFGVSITARFGMRTQISPSRNGLILTVEDPKLHEPLALSNNSEAITNVAIDVEDMEYTSLEIFNSAGTTLRGIYSVKNDGTIAEYSTNTYLDNDFIAEKSCKPKIIMSDDKATVLLEQNLSSAMYNHKITFDLDLNSQLYSLGDFVIGRRANFYYEDKLYNSIITGFEWEVAENEENPQKVKVVLGKVRNKLTAKINLGKVKGHA